MAAFQIETYDFQHLKQCSLGQRLKFFRQKVMQYDDNSNYTITSLGERLNVSPQSISAIERGESMNPSFHLIHKLTKEYHVPLDSVTDEFYEGKEKLFSIGTPIKVEVPDIDDPDDIINAISSSSSQKNTLVDESFFEREVTVGILLYRSYDIDLIEPLFQRQLCKVDDKKLEKLVSRIIFELTQLSLDKAPNYSQHPILESRNVLNNQKDTISSKELGELLQGKKPNSGSEI